MTSLTSINTEIVLRLAYPESFLRSVTPRANEFFSAKLSGNLTSRLDPTRPECLGNVIGAAPVPIASWCGLGLAERAAHLCENRGPMIVGLSYTGAQELERELFVVHTLARGDQESEMLLLPFPASMKLSIRDADEGQPVRLGDLTVPSGVTIRVPGLLQEDVKGTVVQLREDGAWDRLEAARRFYKLILERLEYDKPNLAWDRAMKSYRKREGQHAEAILGDIPDSVARVFLRESGCSSDDARAAIERIWARPLDAPVLAGYVYPKILNTLENDINLDLAPLHPSEERDKYFRLHLPLEEIIAQEHYLGWLPSTGFYRDKRDLIRNEQLAPS